MVTCTRKKPQSVDDRLRWLAPHIDGYKTWLRKKGYREVTITENVRLLACWAEWLRTAGFDLGTIGAGFDASARLLLSQARWFKPDARLCKSRAMADAMPCSMCRPASCGPLRATPKSP
jgi:hypothetical protein